MSRYDDTLDCIDPEKVARIDIVDSLDFTDKEREFLSTKFNLAEEWGYRSDRGNHELFEEKSRDCRQLQFYSDLVFRGLQQQELFSSDMNLVKNAASTSVEKCGDSASVLLQQYFANPNVAASFRELADYMLHDGNTKVFAAIVVAARALMCIANGSFKQAQIHMVLLSESIFPVEESSSEDDDNW